MYDIVLDVSSVVVSLEFARTKQAERIEGLGLSPLGAALRQVRQPANRRDAEARLWQSGR